MDPIPYHPPMATSPSPLARRIPLGLRLRAVLALVAMMAAASPTGATVGVATNEPVQTQTPQRGAAETEQYKVRANLLHRFLKYATFPEGTFAHARSPIVVLVIGDDPFGPLLKATFAKKRIGGRTIQIRRLQRIPNRICAHLVYAHGLRPKDQQELISKLSARPCLLVAEVKGFAEAGGFINLYLDKGKVRFEINESRMKSTGVKLKAELLKLARLVSSAPAPQRGPEPVKEPEAVKEKV